MAKKNKTENSTENSVENANNQSITPSNDGGEITTSDVVPAEDTIPAENDVVAEAEAETPKAKKKQPKKTVAPVAPQPVVQTVTTPRDTFEKAISIKPFVIYQNGVMICHSNSNQVIKTDAKSFEINFKKYSYSGIEVKHV